MTRILTGADLFDGTTRRPGMALVIEDNRIAAILPEAEAPDYPVLHLNGGVLTPGLIDLQVNGGDGILLDGSATAATLARICAAHARLGATGILPTLITDTPQATAAVIKAGIAAAKARVPGFLGLHLEGPHLDPRRHGAHDPALIRPMTDGDLAALIAAARALPTLMVTLAPASARPGQIAALHAAGAVVSLGHADCTLAEAAAAQAAGATSVTHLFNAMSPLGSREPGLVGAALSLPLACGLIADGVHVHPETIRLALAAKSAGEVFLVSDAMAVAGTGLTEFQLGDRRILRRDGRLTLADGTLAGADLSLPQAVRFMIKQVGLSPERALAMASRIPAQVIGSDRGRIAPGLPADLVHFNADWQLTRVWQAGAPVQAN